MSLMARAVDVVPDPLRLAAALAERPGLALLWDGQGGKTSYLACDPIDARQELDPEPGLSLAAGKDDRRAAPRWIGLLPYEGRRSLERPGFGRRVEDRPAPHLERPFWNRYGAVAEISPRGVRVIGDARGAVLDLARHLARVAAVPSAALQLLPAEEDDADHAARIRRALELIAKGELYQVNLARRFSYRVEGHALGLLAAMGRVARAPYASLLCFDPLTVVSTSPELFLKLSADGRLLTIPIKGTRPRGPDAVEDRRLARELDADAKERAELAMIVDVERNDLGRVAVTGSVRLQAAPRVVTHATVHHRAARVVAHLSPGTSRSELLAAMLPSGSVTGAPKVRAMEVIAELEPTRRGLYTGAFGALGHDGGLHLAMAIRTLSVRDGDAHYFAGGGIVADSVPEREVEETRWKAVQVARLASGGPVAAPKIGLIRGIAGSERADRHAPLPTATALDR